LISLDSAGARSRRGSRAACRCCAPVHARVSRRHLSASSGPELALKPHLSMASPGRPLPCFHCGSGSAKACQGCRLAYFCSRECQRQAWPEHKLACQKASPAPCMKLVDMGEGRGAGLRAVARIEMGAEVLREVPLLLAPNKIRHPFGRVLALYDLEPAARRRILLELVVRKTRNILCTQTWMGNNGCS
jgi:hypothetical protein